MLVLIARQFTFNSEPVIILIFIFPLLNYFRALCHQLCRCGNINLSWYAKVFIRVRGMYTAHIVRLKRCCRILKLMLVLWICCHDWIVIIWVHAGGVLHEMIMNMIAFNFLITCRLCLNVTRPVIINFSLQVGRQVPILLRIIDLFRL